jgi:hypothetical protein
MADEAYCRELDKELTHDGIERGFAPESLETSVAINQCLDGNPQPRWRRRQGEGGIHCAIGGNVTGAASVMTGTREMRRRRRDLFQHLHNMSIHSQTRYQAGKKRP